LHEFGEIVLVCEIIQQILNKELDAQRKREKRQVEDLIKKQNRQKKKQARRKF